MFTSLESFSAFFFTCLGLIVLGILFEDKLIALEKRYDAKRKTKKKEAKLCNSKAKKHSNAKHSNSKQNSAKHKVS